MYKIQERSKQNGDKNGPWIKGSELVQFCAIDFQK